MLPTRHLLSTARSLALLLCCAIAVSLLPEPSHAAAGSAGDQSNGKSVARKTTTQKKAVTAKAAANSKRKLSSRKKTYNRNAAASYSYDYKSCVIFNDKSKSIIFTRNPDRKIPPASLTKILSMYVAEDAIRNRKIKRSTKVTVSARAAAAGGSRMGLRAGDKVSLDELLRGMAVASGNDASVAVAEYIGGSEQKFVRMMNQKARAIGMKRSTFKNANGLPAQGQYTTARDMLTLARSYLKAYPGNLAKYHSKSVHVYKSKYSCNANPLLGVLEGADGLKTGFVSASGYNIIATAKRGKQRYIGVILGAPTSAVRARQTQTLMEACFTRPSTFAASKSDINTKPAVKQQNSSSASKAAVKPKKSQAVAKSASSGKGKKQTVKADTSKNKSTATRRSAGKNRQTGKRTADKVESQKKSKKSDQNQTQLPKGQPLVLMSYS